MAKPTTLRWSKLVIFVGDGASPEDFESMVCGMITKGIQFSTETGDSVVPDCDDPDLPSWTERVPRALSASVTGAGVLAEETFADWRDWFLSAAAKNVRIGIELAVQGYFYGSFVMTAFEAAGNEGDGKIQVNLTLQSDGAVAWQAGTP